MFDLSTINVWGVLGASAAGYVLGGVWFAPRFFGAAWARSIGKKQEDLGNPALSFGLMALTIVISTTALALLFQAAGLDTLVRGLAGGALVGIGFVFPTMLSDAVFPGHIKTWWWINAAYRIVALLIIGGILGATAPESTLHKLERAASEAGSNVTNTLEVIGKSLGK